MSTESLLIISGVVLSVVAILVFLIYYLVATKGSVVAEVAEKSGYQDKDVYIRDQTWGKPRYLSWSVLSANDAKSVGLRYIFTSLLFLFLAGAIGVFMRISLVDPNPTIITPIVYNVLLTQHAVLMIYMFALGSAVGLAYYLLPTELRLKRDDLGRYSSFAYWVWLLGGVLFFISQSSMRWYMYPPLSLQMQTYGAGVYNSVGIFAVELIFIGVLMASIIVLRIILIDRSDDIPLSKMPIFAWAMVFTAIMLISSALPLMVGVAMLFYDVFNPIFFLKDPLTFAVIFWFWGHPVVYLAVLPAFGLMYDVITRFAKRPMYSYSSGVFSLGLLMILSELVWGHHLLNSGLGVDWVLFFTTSSFFVAIPSAITVFNMIATLWTAKKIRITTPMLFVLNAILDFTLGGVAGVMLANQSINEIAHGTYFVTGHFHFIFVGVTLGVFMAIFYLLYPTFSHGRTYDTRLARWHFYFTAVGSFLMSVSWEVGGFIGMPRAVAGYFPQFQPYQDSAILGGIIIGIGQLIFLYNIAKSWSTVPTVDPTNILEYRTETNDPIESSDLGPIAAKEDGGSGA